ncbi:hypothetical protein JWG45_20230 [Leptospira sp. 201903070]|jgi:hypothetical protein|uniref:Secreted protein n=1 Tax=Leptospira ainlahdjerensis TaxID=2810033 RepID=A0ABS2UGH0_9LEPT|nr:hypothetical protein [Leptospira ainlahdjerensis]MBM9579476.1 hypothetical protein [Leptospira ainlahdjerensis]
MKFVFFLYVILIGMLFNEMISAVIQSRPSEKNSKIKNENPHCCSVEIGYSDSVVLESVCLEKERTVFNFRYLLSNGICSYSNRLEMKDSNSKRYASLGTNRIGECPKLSQVKPGHRFQWYFDPIKNKPSTVDVTEDLTADPISSDWRWWHWEKINLSRCDPKG